MHARLISLVAESLDVAPESISITRPLRDYGFDSMAAVTLTADIEDWLRRLGERGESIRPKLNCPK